MYVMVILLRVEPDEIVYTKVDRWKMTKDKRKLRMDQFVFIVVIVLLSLLPLHGCIDLDDAFNLIDPVLRRADPYISKIELDDLQLQTYALSLLNASLLSDREYVITRIYRHIIETYEYIPDPEDEELIRSPQETIHLQGGDCEDLSILLCSLLENLGIKTYLVLTDTHAYCLAYDVNITHLKGYVEQELMEQVEEDSGSTIVQQYQNVLILKKYQSWYYGGDGSRFQESDSFDYMNLTYEFRSTKPLSVYIVPSQEDFEKYSDRKPFNHFESYDATDVTILQGVCPYMKTHGGIILTNDNFKDATVSINLTFYFHPSFYKLFKNNTIQSYMLNGAACIVLEPTAGAYGYPGYDANVTGEKTAIDPITKEYYYLA